MSEQERQYIAIDLKSFYASVECVERGLDPLDACLVVADESRTTKTICLAVSPPLKSFGLPGRPRLFEVVRRVREINRGRGRIGRSYSATELRLYPHKALDYIVATPRMKLYKEYSARIYSVYLRFIAPEDIHMYSCDEVFIDATPYQHTYGMTTCELASTIVAEVFRETGITATAGIGTNLYLSKVAMDILAKKMVPDANGVRIAELDEMSYRRLLWSHTPLTDFWRIGQGTARKLAAYGILTMGDIARRSLTGQKWYYDQFGVSAELLIDHAWGYEPVTMAEVKAYRPETHSMSSGQVLCEPYSFAKARNVLLEMADTLTLKLVGQRMATDHMTLTVSYDIVNLTDPNRRAAYSGAVSTDHYGRAVPRKAHGSAKLQCGYTDSNQAIVSEAGSLFDRLVNPSLLVRKLNLSLDRLIAEESIPAPKEPVQLDLFTDYEELHRQREQTQRKLDRERRCQEVILDIRRRFGKNSILRGLNYAEGATQRIRNQQIGGHKA
ncbi:MAG: DNA methylase [Muribaculaceae bacterium]|nr:DNA methylase [Muribaculaceae bacterium]